MDGGEELAAQIRRTLSDRGIWEMAELHVLGSVPRERLAALGICPSPEVGAALMVAAQLLAPTTPEWDGDARDVLADLAILGLRLLEPGPP